MSRLFDAVDDESRHSIGSTSFGFGSMIAVLKRNNTSWSSIMANHSSTPAGVVGLMFNSSNQLVWFDQTSLKAFTGFAAVTNTTGWVLVAVGKTTGTTTPRGHKYVFDTATWQHADAAATISDRTAQTSGAVRIGQIDNSDFFGGRMAVLAQRANTAPLSDADVESLITNFTRSFWDGLGMTFLVDELDAFATDYGGTSTQTSLVGTADDADDPTNWASWAGGGGGAAVIGTRKSLLGVGR